MLLDLNKCFVGAEADDGFLEKRASDHNFLPLILGCAELICTVCACCHSAETPCFELCLPCHHCLRPLLSTENVLYASVTPQQDILPFCP